MSEGRLCIKLMTDQADWDTQAKNCQGMFNGADLIFISDNITEIGIGARIDKYLTGAPAAACKEAGFHIGLAKSNHQDCNSDYTWQSIATKMCKPQFDYTDWMDGQPSCSSDETCVQLKDVGNKKLKWNAVSCQTSACAICSIPGY